MEKREVLESQTEHRNDQPEEDLSYPGAEEEHKFWEQVLDKNLLQFRNELEKINEGRTADILNHRMDVRNLPENSRNEIFADCAKAFDKVDFGAALSNFEKRVTSQDIAQTLFKPMQVDLARESHSQFNQSGAETPHSTEVLDCYQEMFSRALRGGYSGKNPSDVHLMSESFREANDYIRGENPTDHGAMSQQEFSEFTKTSPEHQFTESLKIMHHTWKDSQDSVDQMRQENHPELQDAQIYLIFAKDIIHKQDLCDALERKSYDDFTKINEAARLGGDELAGVIRNNQGFVNRKGYEQCELPEKFETVEDAIQYAEKTREQLDDMTGNEKAMSSVAHRSAMAENVSLAGWIENIQSEMNTAADNPDPEYRKTHLEEASAYLDAVHQSARALHFIMKPGETGD